MAESAAETRVKNTVRAGATPRDGGAAASAKRPASANQETRKAASPNGPVKRFGTKLKSMLPGKKKNDFVRRFERHPCCVVAVLHLLDRGYDMDGVLLEISEGGCLFRGASQFIMDRTGEAVTVHFAGENYSGTIVNVRPQGYGVKLNESLPPELVRHIAREFSYAAAMSGGFSGATTDDSPGGTAAAPGQ